MSLKHAILGFLEMSPLSGYDLKKMFGASVQFYWPATHSQIYRTLDQMLKDKLVTRKIIYQQDTPNKKIYYITDRGKQELRTWLKTPQELPAIRHKLLIQLAWADQLENEEIISLLTKYAEEVNSRLEKYRSQEQEMVILNYARTDRENYLWRMVLANGINVYEVELKWAMNTIEGLKAFAQ